MNRLVPWHDLEFEIRLLDIQQLNHALFAGEFDVAKCSFHAALLLADRTLVMPCGSALGYGVGPLLLAGTANQSPCQANQLTLCPGEHTTAALLFQLFYPKTTRVEHTVFSNIMPRLQNGAADFGVCIHEGRFTFREQGLTLVEDLGARWERDQNCPLPLGGLVADRNLDGDVLAKIHRVIRDSLDYANTRPDEALQSMRKYAQEFDDDVLRKHVELYVNEWTIDLGDVGRSALGALSSKARDVGLIGRDAPALEVFSSSGS